MYRKRSLKCLKSISVWNVSEETLFIEAICMRSKYTKVGLLLQQILLIYSAKSQETFWLATGWRWTDQDVFSVSRRRLWKHWSNEVFGNWVKWDFYWCCMGCIWIKNSQHSIWQHIQQRAKYQWRWQLSNKDLCCHLSLSGEGIRVQTDIKVGWIEVCKQKLFYSETKPMVIEWEYIMLCFPQHTFCLREFFSRVGMGGGHLLIDTSSVKILKSIYFFTLSTKKRHLYPLVLCFFSLRYYNINKQFIFSVQTDSCSVTGKLTYFLHVPVANRGAF